MWNIIVPIIGTLIFTLVCGVIGYFLWLRLRPKKIIYKARVYVKSDGVLPALKDHKGRIISDLKLQDLKPYARDIIEKVEKEKGISVYRLKMLNKPVPPVETDVIDLWGKDDKEVNVLLENDCCTLLKKGFDKNSGIIFSPLPHDRMNMITNQMTIKKDRVAETKSAFEAIAPFVKVTMWIIGMVLLTWIITTTYLEMNEVSAEAQKYTADRISSIYAVQCGNPDPTIPIQPSLGPQNTAPMIDGT